MRKETVTRRQREEDDRRATREVYVYHEAAPRVDRTVIEGKVVGR